MVTGVDASVVFALYKGEPSAEAWLEILRRQREGGRLLICDVALAEASAAFDDEEETLSFFQDLGVSFDPILPGTAILAGSLFKDYRRRGCPRERLIPDFLIGAHALRQCDQLAAADRGYLRRHFPKLKVVAPR